MIKLPEGPIIELRVPPTAKEWAWIDRETDTTWILYLTDVAQFRESLSPDRQIATQSRPNAGLPRNLWIGGPLPQWESLLLVRATRRFLVIDEFLPGVTDLQEPYGTWRCVICGYRGRAPRPDRCAHVNLCGGETIGPEFHFVLNDSEDFEEIRRIAKPYGIACWRKP